MSNVNSQFHEFRDQRQCCDLGDLKRVLGGKGSRLSQTLKSNAFNSSLRVIDATLFKRVSFSEKSKKHSSGKMDLEQERGGEATHLWLQQDFFSEANIDGHRAEFYCRNNVPCILFLGYVIKMINSVIQQNLKLLSCQKLMKHQNQVKLNSDQCCRNILVF